MTTTQAEYIKSQIKTLVSMKDILDFYVGESDWAKRYTCPFNPTENRKNLSIKNQHLCRCFSCGETWDEISFVQKLFNYNNYHEALERIAVDFHLDTKDGLNSETVKRINEMKRQKEEERRRQKQKEEFVRKLCNKICDRQFQLENVIREHYPRKNKNLIVYGYTKHPDYVIKAMKQYLKNEMLLNVLMESDTDDRTDFIYGLAPFKEDKAKRKEETLDMIRQGVIKINEKGDVLYG